MKIVNADCSAESDLYRLAHDVFVFSYLCGGIAFVDVANLTPANIVDGRFPISVRKRMGQSMYRCQSVPCRLFDGIAIIANMQGICSLYSMGDCI